MTYSHRLIMPFVNSASIFTYYWHLFRSCYAFGYWVSESKVKSRKEETWYLWAQLLLNVICLIVKLTYVYVTYCESNDYVTFP